MKQIQSRQDGSTEDGCQRVDLRDRDLTHSRSQAFAMVLVVLPCSKASSLLFQHQPLHGCCYPLCSFKPAWCPLSRLHIDHEVGTEQAPSVTPFPRHSCCSGSAWCLTLQNSAGLLSSLLWARVSVPLSTRHHASSSGSSRNYCCSLLFGTPPLADKAPPQAPPGSPRGRGWENTHDFLHPPFPTAFPHRCHTDELLFLFSLHA